MKKAAQRSMPTDKLTTLRRRAELLRETRYFFEQRGYWEVETPLLSHETCIDRWLDPFEMQVHGERCFLQTSPEFAMKRLVCEGADAIYQVCKAFRSGEMGDHHNPEFTMVEWYRVGTPLIEQIDLVEALVTHLSEYSSERGWIPEPFATTFHRMSYDDAFLSIAGFSALETSTPELEQFALREGWTLPASGTSDRDDLLNYLLVQRVDPHLAKYEAVSVFDYPASQAALAQVRNDTVPVAERFEMYLSGAEICNGYQELTDSEELRRRMTEHNIKRTVNGKAPLPVESHLLRTMEEKRLPESSGVALGFDRLVMKCLGLESLSDAIAFPFPEA